MQLQTCLNELQEETLRRTGIPPVASWCRTDQITSNCPSFCVAEYSTMDIIIMIILGIVGGVMIATVAVCGIYYSYRTKKDRETEKTAAKVATSAPARRSARTESEPYVVYQDESLVDFDSIPVQPETKRPIRYSSSFLLQKLL